MATVCILSTLNSVFHYSIASKTQDDGVARPAETADPSTSVPRHAGTGGMTKGRASATRKQRPARKTITILPVPLESRCEAKGEAA
jgi:hypothetical protein